MKKFLAAVLCLCFCLWPLPNRANFAIFQVASTAIVIPTADAVCDFATGTYTGFGGGTCIASPAPCDGVADAAAPFRAFVSWAITLQTAHPGALIQLSTSSGTCAFISQDVNTNNTAGIKHFQLVASGTTFSDNSGTGGGFALGGTGVRFDSDYSVLFATITAGATSITLLDLTKCGLFAASDWTLLTGIDPQGFGDPPNPQIYEYIKINSVAACAGTGVITLQSPTRNGYKSTWPLYNPGRSGLNSNAGGPAMIYALDQRWDIEQAFYGLTIDQQGAQTNSNGRSISFYNLTAPSGFCPIPSQNVTWSITNGNIPNCGIEFDKIIETVTMTNVSLRRIIIQTGADPQNFICNNCNISYVMTGTAGNTTINGGYIEELDIGASSYGVSGAFVGNNVSMGAFSWIGASSSNIQARGTWSSGTLTIPQNFHITGSTDNGSGLTRLTVDTTVGYSTGFITDVVSFVDVDNASSCNNQNVIVTVIDGTHFDIQGSDATANNVAISIASPAVITKVGHGFSIGRRVVLGTTGALATPLLAGTAYYIIASGFTANSFQISATDGGAAINTSGSQSGQQFLQCSGGGGSLPLTWAVPRANVYFSGQHTYGPILQVADLAVGANNSTVVSFNQNGAPYAGGLPTMPGSAWQITAHPAPSFSCIGCTGPQQLLDISVAGASGLPFGSYASRVVTSANNNVSSLPIFGALSSVSFTVNSACSGASNFGFDQVAAISTLGSATIGSWNPTVNAAVASGTPRVLTPTAASGTQSGDSLTPPGVGTWLLINQSWPIYSNVGNCGTASTTVTVQTDQGVVYP